MKSQDRLSQLTLELYYRGLATNKERRLVENALRTDSVIRKYYEELQESDREIRRLVTQELKRLNIPESSPAPSPRKKRFVLILAAAVLLCALIPAILYIKNSVSNKDSVIAEETAHSTETNDEETDFFDDVPDIELAGNFADEPSPSEPPAVIERGNSNSRIETAETPRAEPVRSAEPELRLDPSSGVSVAVVPAPDTNVQQRGGSARGSFQPEPYDEEPEEMSNINIPPGLSFIFDNMFANRGLTFVIIPSRVTSIGRNAFQGNPLVSVTIGANVSIEDSAIPGNFAAIYNAGDKAAGTYTRLDVNSEEWEKK